MPSGKEATTMSDAIDAIFEKANSGDLVGAHSDLLALLEQNPEDETIALNLASICLDLGKIDDVVTICQGLIAKGKQHAGAHLLLSRAFYVKGDLDGGFEHIGKAWTLAPESHDIALDFLLAARNRYWTLRQDEYEDYLERSAGGELALEEAQRFVHQAFARLIRPEFLDRLCNFEEGDANAVIPSWAANLEANEASNMKTLWTNFKEGLRVIYNEPEWAARA
ncbi:MAG: hypothetical protein KDB07_12625, partial [Planctomycetes bacterium]|nr:hypothetical protein [Planctomycetota bacterium]